MRELVIIWHAHIVRWRNEHLHRYGALARACFFQGLHEHIASEGTAREEELEVPPHHLGVLKHSDEIGRVVARLVGFYPSAQANYICAEYFGRDQVLRKRSKCLQERPHSPLCLSRIRVHMASHTAL